MSWLQYFTFLKHTLQTTSDICNKHLRSKTLKLLGIPQCNMCHVTSFKFGLWIWNLQNHTATTNFSFSVLQATFG